MHATLSSEVSTGNPVDRQSTHEFSHNAWTQHAPALAAWTDKTLVNRRDAYGSYIAREARTDPDRTAITAKSPVTLAVLQRHFAGRSTGDLIGLHSTARDEANGEGEIASCWSRWLGIDIDRHDDDTNPDVTREAAKRLLDIANQIGFSALLFDSNGRGGYHLLVIFEAPVPTEKVHALGKWMVREWKTIGLSSEPEIFPKQASIPAGGFGNWLRLPGLHHSRDHHTKVWGGSSWLEGSEAIKAIIRTKGSPADLIPVESLTPPKPERKPKNLKVEDVGKDATLASDALGYLDPSMPYPDWLNVGMALTQLGREGLELWDRWSSDSAKYQEGLCDRKWRSFSRSGVQLGSLFHIAKAKGFEFPKSDVAKKSKAPSSAKSEEQVEKTEELRPNEAHNDPHRLARIYIESYCSHPAGPTLVFHNGEFHRWDGTYRPLLDKEIRADLGRAAKYEFDRINMLALKKHQRDKGEKAGNGHEAGKQAEPPKVEKVTSSLVNNVTLALSGLSMLDGRVKSPAWLGKEAAWPAQEILPTRNALLHLPSFVGGKSPHCLPPTPMFFSPTRSITTLMQTPPPHRYGSSSCTNSGRMIPRA